MFYLKEPTIFKNILESYTSLFLGPYFNTGLLIVFGILFAGILYFIPKKYKFKAVLVASLIFALISASIVNFILFFIIVVILYLSSNYNFKYRNITFWIGIGLLLTSVFIYYKIFNFHSPYYSFAAYYTMFRSIHYFIDVKQGSLPKVKFIDYISYLYFFPSFSHGPIDRIGNIYPSDIKKENIIFGFKRIFIGISKYLILIYVLSNIEKVPFSLDNLWQWLLFTAYGGAIKLYIILSGDIDIVIGISSLMGFKVSENYPKVPFFQRSITKFWQNWQATVVNWLIAYVYFPLCRNKRYIYLKTMFILMIIGWLHLFYNFKVPIINMELVLFYTLWGVFMGGVLALSKFIEKKKAYSREMIENRFPTFARFFYADNIFTKGLAIFITFNIIAIGLNSPLYLLLNELR